MVAAGNVEVPTEAQRWPMNDTFLVLGHLLQPTGSIRACWSRTKAVMWKAFWTNPDAESAKNVSIPCKLQLLTRAVQPQMSFRCSRWPPQRQIAHEVDTLQQKITASMLRVPRNHHEEPADYIRRRGRLARALCQKQGRWSAHWFTRACAWDKHISRGHNDNAWSAKLRDYRGKEWLMQRRADLAPHASSASLSAGRTGTRAIHGKVQVR